MTAAFRAPAAGVPWMERPTERVMLIDHVRVEHGHRRKRIGLRDGTRLTVIGGAVPQVAECVPKAEPRAVSGERWSGDAALDVSGSAIGSLRAESNRRVTALPNRPPPFTGSADERATDTGRFYSSDGMRFSLSASSRNSSTNVRGSRHHLPLAAPRKRPRRGYGRTMESLIKGGQA